MARTALFAVVVALALGLSAGSARAVAPVLDSVDLPLYYDHPTFNWALPSGANGVIWSDHVVTAKTSEVNSNNDGEFLQKNWLTFNVLDHAQTSYTDLREYSPGTYFVHIAGHDPACTTSSCTIEFSNVLSFTVVAPPPGGGGGGGSADKLAPLQTLSFQPVQDVDKLHVTARVSEAGKLSAGGKVGVSRTRKRYRLKGASRSVAANVTTNLRLKLAKKSLRRVKRALKRHKRAKANVTVTATDAAGNTRSQKLTIRLKN